MTATPTDYCQSCDHPLVVHDPHPSGRVGRGSCAVPGCPCTSPRSSSTGLPARLSARVIRLVEVTAGDLAWTDETEHLSAALGPRTADDPPGAPRVSDLGAVVVGQLRIRSLGEDVEVDEDSEDAEAGWYVATAQPPAGACPDDPRAAARRELRDSDPGAGPHLHGRVTTGDWYPEQIHALARRIELLGGDRIDLPWSALAADLRTPPAGDPETSHVRALTDVLFALDRFISDVEDAHRRR